MASTTPSRPAAPARPPKAAMMVAQRIVRDSLPLPTPAPADRSHLFKTRNFEAARMRP